MSGPNPLIAKPKETATGVTGIGIAESAVDLANGISDGSWVEGGLGALGVGLEMLSMVIDPVGTMLQYGVSWLIEHVEPLKEALDWFAGDPPVIQSFADTWANVATEVNAVAADLQNEAKGGTAGWEGTAADAYRGQSTEQADAIAGAGALADGISGGVMVMGMVVAAVRELVRDLVAELVAKLITWALEAVATLGLGTPVIVAQATAAIAKVTNRISDLVRKLIKTIGNVTPRLRKVIDKLGEIMEKLSKIGRKLDGGTTPSGVHGPKVDAPSVKSPDAPTTPSSSTTPSGTSSPDAPSTKSPDSTSPSSTSPDGTPGSSSTPNGSKSPDGSRGPEGSLRKDAASPETRAERPIGRCGGREPVDLATGEMYLVQTDLRLAGLLPLVLERTHVSSYRAGRLFGPSWSSTLDQRLEIDDDGVCYAGPDGVILVYPTPPVDGTPVLPVTGAQWPLRVQPDGMYAVTEPQSGRTWWFTPPAGGVAPISAISDRNGHRMDFDYESGSVRAIRHSGGHHVQVGSADGLVTELRLLDPRTGAGIPVVRFGYDGARRLTEVINSSGRPLRFEYDEEGRITKWVDRNDRWYAYHYDSTGRCVRTEGSGNALAGSVAYDPENRVTVESDSLGNRTTYHFTEAYKLARKVNPLGQETSYEWNGDGQLTSLTDALGRTTRYVHNENGDVATVVRPDGLQMYAQYNELRQVIRLQGADGAVWRREYDDRGNVLAVVNPGGALVRYQYDTRGRLTAITDPSGTRRIRMNEAGLPVAVSDAHNATTHYDRDTFGRITAFTDPNGNTTRFGWTIEGKVSFRTQPDGSTERWSYDGEGNQLAHTDVHGRVSRVTTTHLDMPAVATDQSGGRNEFTYDSELRLTAVTNAQGLTWHYVYDAAGNLARERDFNGRELAYTYDAAGQLSSRTNGAGQTVRFQRDALGNVVQRQFDDGSVVTFEFDDAGRMVRATNAHADVRYEHDANGSVVAESINGRTVSSAYDAAGMRRYRRTPTGVETWWEYDENRRPRAMRTAGNTVTFGYDPAGREVERLIGAGTVLAQHWDSANRLVGQTVSSRFAGQPHRAGVVQQRRYEYFPDGSLQSVEDQLSGTRRFQLDQMGRATAVTARDWQETYAYDPAGNLTMAHRSGADGSAQGGRSYAGTRLQAAGDVRYGYDAQGRVVVRSKKRLSAKPAVWHYEWDSEDRLVAVGTPEGARWRYHYDALGRRISKQRLGPDGTAVMEQVDFVWDGATLAEQSDSAGRAIAWDYQPGTFRPISQLERTATRDADQRWVDEQFFAIVTDLVGTPSELIDSAGAVAWRGTTTLWGASVPAAASRGYTPLRFQGQYHDAESGLHYNYQRYYDPESGRYQTVDPLGLAPGPNPESYVPNPTGQVDPLGLSGCDPHLFRGTTEGYAGSPGMQRVGVTPTSTDPAVATTFATHSEQYGNGVVQIARPDDVAGVQRLDPSLGALEGEVPLDIPPSEFTSRASHTIPVSQAREILTDMGVPVPAVQQVSSIRGLDDWLQHRTPMTDSQIGEFVRRATGGT